MSIYRLKKGWAKEQERILRIELCKVMRKASPFYAWVEDNYGRYLDDEV